MYKYICIWVYEVQGTLASQYWQHSVRLECHDPKSYKLATRKNKYQAVKSNHIK